MSYLDWTRREWFYDSLSIHQQEEQMFYKSLEHEPIRIGSFEYNLTGLKNDLALITRFDIGSWNLWHTSIQSNPISEQITIHNPNLWPAIYMNARSYDSETSENNSYLLAYYNAVNDKVQKDSILKRKRELFEQCAQGIYLTNLPYEKCLEKLILIKQRFDDILNDFGRYV